MQQDAPPRTAVQRLIEPLSTKWIQSAAGVSRDTVAAWRSGREPNPTHWERFLAVYLDWQAGIEIEPSGPRARGLKESLDEVATLLRRVLVDPGGDPPEPRLEELASLPERLELARRRAKRTRGRK